MELHPNEYSLKLGQLFCPFAIKNIIFIGSLITLTTTMMLMMTIVTMIVMMTTMTAVVMMTMMTTVLVMMTMMVIVVMITMMTKVLVLLMMNVLVMMMMKIWNYNDINRDYITKVQVIIRKYTYLYRGRYNKLFQNYKRNWMKRFPRGRPKRRKD